MSTAAKEEMHSPPTATRSVEEIFSLAALFAVSSEPRIGANAPEGKKPHPGIFSRNRTIAVGATWAKWPGTHQVSGRSWPKTVLGIAIDANGNTLTDASGRSYTWDFENRLIQAVVPGTNGGTTTFRYDPFGRRIQKSGPLGTTNYLYDRKNLVAEVDSSGSVIARYTQGKGIDRPLAQLRSGTTSYYEQDGLGSVTSLSNSAGALAGTYTYDSYGKATASTGTLTNPFQYTGREFDSETTLLFNRARYFDPGAGRFLSQDSIRFGGGTNFYAYTRNNPVVRTDPFGYYSGSGVVGSIYLGPDGVWQNDGPPLPPDPSNPTCSPEQWAQSPGACAGPQGADEPDPWMPNPNKKCDQPKDQPQDQPPDDQPPPDQQPEPIPHLLSERACLAWTLGEGVIAGFAEGSAAFGQFEVTVPMLVVDGLSAGAHYVACGNFFDLGIGPF
jgi:RHS repeat-associated protein